MPLSLIQITVINLPVIFLWVIESLVLLQSCISYWTKLFNGLFAPIDSIRTYTHVACLKFILQSFYRAVGLEQIFMSLMPERQTGLIITWTEKKVRKTTTSNQVVVPIS